MLAQALDYTYWDIETETQYKHTNCPSILSELELRAVKPHTDTLFWGPFENYRDFCCCDERGG